MTKITYTAKEKLAHAIGILARDAGRIQNRIHNLGVSILKVWHTEGEAFAVEATEYLNNLMEASPYHTRAFSIWIGANTNLSFSEENGKFYVEEGKEGAGVVYDRQWKAAVAKPFWKLSPPQKAKPFDLDAEIMSLIDRATKRAAKGQEGDVIDLGQLRALRDVLSQAA